VHMSWGAINEWSAHSAYRQMIVREDHPELTKLLRRVQAQESRHLAFYASQAKERLARSVRAQRLTRWAMKSFWGPVGSTIEPKRETAFVLGYLFGGDDGADQIGRIDAKMDEMPGMAGLHLVRRATAKFGVGPGVHDLRPAPIDRLRALGGRLGRTTRALGRHAKPASPTALSPTSGAA